MIFSNSQKGFVTMRCGKRFQKVFIRMDESSPILNVDIRVKVKQSTQGCCWHSFYHNSDPGREYEGAKLFLTQVLQANGIGGCKSISYMALYFTTGIQTSWEWLAAVLHYNIPLLL